MIAKGKAIAHGKVAIEYAMREAKNSDLIASNLIQNNTSNEIYQEFTDVQKYNTRCKNKFIRFEIGIAPQDENKLTTKDLEKICNDFSKHLGLENHQWIACVHRDTDNLHIHLIANRIGIDQSVYDTSFISNRASNTADKISLDMGLTEARKIVAKNKQRFDVVGIDRILARTRIEKLAKDALLDKPISLKEFQETMKEKGISIQEVKNKKGNTYGLRFSGYGETFKASTIGQEFGYRTLLQTFRENEMEMEIDYEQSLNQSYSTKSSSLTSSLFSILQDSGESMGNDYSEDNNQNKRRRHGR